MARQDLVFFVDDDRVSPAELSDAARDALDLFCVVSVGVLRMRLERGALAIGDRDAVDLGCRLSSLLSLLKDDARVLIGAGATNQDPELMVADCFPDCCRIKKG